MTPTVIVGRGAFSGIGKDNDVGSYARVVGKPLDGSDPTKDTNYEAVAYGVLAIQARLNDYLAYYVPEAPQIPLTSRFGIQSTGSTVWFQKHKGLKPDGRPGPVTCEALWHDLFVWYAAANGVPVEILWAMSKLESGFDPGAVSRIINLAKGPDRGLCQINQVHLGSISLPDMFDPHESIDYTADRFAGALRQFAGKGPDLQLRAAILQHNSPLAARTLFEVGSIGADEAGAKYIALVMRHADTFV